MCFNKRLTLLTLKSPAGRREPEVAESSVVWADVKGTYSPLLSNHHDCYKRLGVDPDSDSEFIEKWFATAGFYTAGTDADSTDGG